MDQQTDYLHDEIEDLKLPNTMEAVELFTFLTKAIKAKLVYPSSSKLPTQFKDEVASKADQIFENIDSLKYKIDSNSILYGDTPVYKSTSRSENFAHLFFRDGLIGLTFIKGVNKDELSRFVDLLAKMLRTVYIDDDLATLFWEENFHYISYDLIDDGLDIETVEYSVDSFKSEIETSNDDIQLIFRDEGEITFDDDDFDEEKKQFGQGLRGYRNQDVTQKTFDFLNHISEFTEEERKQIDKLLAEDSRFNHTEYLLTVVFEILGMEKELPGYVEVLGFIGKVRDNFIQLGNFSGVSALMIRMHEIFNVLNNLNSKRAEKIEEFFLDCASKKKIEFLTETINKIKDLDAESLSEYLRQLPWAAIDPLLVSLGELEDYKARRAVCTVLAELGKDQIDLIARGLDDERWYVVRNVVMVMGEIGSSRVINYLKRTIRHSDYRVRLETLVAASNIDSNDSYDFMILALSDQDEKIQNTSLDYLIKSNCVRAFRAIEHVVKDKKFKNRPPEQVRKYYEAYAVIGRNKAVDYLKNLATKKSFFASTRDERMRGFAIEFLAKTGTSEAYLTLNKIVQGKNNKFAMIAMRALARRKKGDS